MQFTRAKYPTHKYFILHFFHVKFYWKIYISLVQNNSSYYPHFTARYIMQINCMKTIYLDKKNQTPIVDTTVFPVKKYLSEIEA